MSWDHRQYGTIADPIRQSDLNALTSSYACSKQFQFRKIEDSEGTRSERSAGWKRVIGNATHQVFDRILVNAKAKVLAGWVPSLEQVSAALRAEMEIACEGLPISWRNGKGKPDADADHEIEEAAHMVRGGIKKLGEVAIDIVLVEAPFFVTFVRDGKTYCSIGTLDCAYRSKAKPDAIGLVDWKTGEQLLSQIVLNHGYQFGIYGDALAQGWFFPHKAALARFLALQVEHALNPDAPAYVVGTCGEFQIGQFPEDIHVAHLRDHVPYSRAGDKKPNRPEQLEFYGITAGAKVKYVKGDARGPGWYRAHRTPADRARLIQSIHTIVGTVRLGRFLEHVDEKCERCSFSSRCLTEGFAPVGSEAKALEKILAGIDFDGIGEEAA